MPYDADLALLLSLTGSTGDRIEDLLVDDRPVTPSELERLIALPAERLDELTPVVQCLRVLMAEQIAERDRCWAEVDEMERAWCTAECPTIDLALAAGLVPSHVVERLAVVMAKVTCDPLTVTPVGA